jgi:hypothetical protein
MVKFLEDYEAFQREVYNLVNRARQIDPSFGPYYWVDCEPNELVIRAWGGNFITLQWGDCWCDEHVNTWDCPIELLTCTEEFLEGLRVKVEERKRHEREIADTNERRAFNKFKEDYKKYTGKDFDESNL